MAAQCRVFIDDDIIVVIDGVSRVGAVWVPSSSGRLATAARTMTTVTVMATPTVSTLCRSVARLRTDWCRGTQRLALPRWQRPTAVELSANDRL